MEHSFSTAYTVHATNAFWLYYPSPVQKNWNGFTLSPVKKERRAASKGLLPNFVFATVIFQARCGIITDCFKHRKRVFEAEDRKIMVSALVPLPGWIHVQTES